jgi:hypothetical protein
MNPVKIIVLSAIVVAIAIFFAGDADLPIYLAPAAPENAFKDKVIWITGEWLYPPIIVNLIESRGVIGNWCWIGHGAGKYECESHCFCEKVCWL